MSNMYLVRQLVDIKGGAANGTAEFFESGTTTPVTVYEDKALSISLGTSISADAQGLFSPVYVNNELLRVVRKIDGVVIDSVDDVNPKSGSGLIMTAGQSVEGGAALRALGSDWVSPIDATAPNPITEAALISAGFINATDRAINTGLVKAFADVSNLVSDNTLTYLNVSAGDYVKAGQYEYEIAASDATDHHILSAGSVKYYVLPDDGGTYNFAAFPSGTTESNFIAAIIAIGAGEPISYRTNTHYGFLRDASALNYQATKASHVIQHRDTASGSQNDLIPSTVSQITLTGDGFVTPGSELSETIWLGNFASVTKSGDGSAHGYTVIGELRDYGASGYNELGAFQAELTANGTDLGYISVFEGLIKDSPDSGATTNSTRMTGIATRIAKYDPTTRPSYNFFASSEGTQDVDAILGLNAQGTKKWKYGFDLSNGIFSTGQGFRMPNNVSYASNDTGGTSRALMFLSGTNETFLVAGAGGTGDGITLSNSAFAAKLKTDNDANDGVQIFIGGSLRRLGLGAADSGGTGFKQVIVAN